MQPPTEIIINEITISSSSGGSTSGSAGAALPISRRDKRLTNGNTGS